MSNLNIFTKTNGKMDENKIVIDCAMCNVHCRNGHITYLEWQPIAVEYWL